MIDGAEKAIKFYGEVQVIVAVIFGLILQVLLGDKRGYKIVTTVAISSIFVALFIVPAIIEISGIDPKGKIAIALYALSALMSVEMLALIIKILPEALRARAKHFLGVANDLPES